MIGHKLAPVQDKKWCRQRDSNVFEILQTTSLVGSKAKLQKHFRLLQYLTHVYTPIYMWNYE